MPAPHAVAPCPPAGYERNRAEPCRVNFFSDLAVFLRCNPTLRPSRTGKSSATHPITSEASPSPNTDENQPRAPLQLHIYSPFPRSEILCVLDGAWCLAAHPPQRRPIFALDLAKAGPRGLSQLGPFVATQYTALAQRTR